MKRRLTFIFASLFLCVGMALAQTKVSGKVVQADDGEPIIGASVMVTGTNTGGATDIDGNFVVTLPQGKTKLTISYIGMKTVEVTAKDGMTIKMETDSKVIDEVVVTGYGVQKKASFTGAASLMTEEMIEKKNDANFVKTLEGSVTGVQMNNSSSMPGTWGSVYVRGRGSLNSGTQPLYVVDGIPVSSDSDAMSSTSNNSADPMAGINPNDIESVTVLKDAAATSIYGARAGNGVIVIKTKSGAQGKHNINVDIKQGFVAMANNNMKYANAEQTMRLYATGLSNRYKDGTVDEYYDYLKQDYGWDGVSSYNWMDLVTRNGYYQDYNINITGSAGNTSYFISGGYLNTKGLVIASDYERYSGRINVNSKFKIFNVGANMSYAATVGNGFGMSTGGSFSNPLVGAVSSMQPFYNPYTAEGKYTNIDLYNPLAVWDEKLGNLHENRTTTLNISPYLMVDFGKGIYFKTTLGVNLYTLREYDYWSGVYTPEGIDNNGLGQLYKSTNSTITWNNILGWNYTFDEAHTIGVMLGQEMQKKDYNYDYMYGKNFPFVNEGIRDLTTTGTWGDGEQWKSEARLASYFMDFHYSYLDKYYASASYRRDGSSVFGSEERWGDFWSLGAKWRFTQEDFLGLKDNKVLTNGTFRISYGTVGNQDIGFYAARGFYRSGANYHNQAGLVTSGITNPTLTWETSKKFDVGFDLSFINRINLSLDYYNETTTGALYDVPLSMTTGAPSATKNIGSIRNRGLEVTLNAVIMNTRDFNWTAYANLTWNQNRVVELSGDPIVGSYSVIKPGYAYGTFYIKEYAGVRKEDGRALWYLNETGDETTDVYSKAASRYMGSPDPKVFGGFGSQFRWKGLDASLTFNYRLGAKVLDTGAQFTGWGMTNRTPLEEVALNSWTPENPNALYPQYIYGDPYASTSRSSRFLYNGSFLRLSNITVGYTLPQYITQKAFMDKVRFYISLDNLYTFTASDFVGYNPETYTTGVIAWQYPATMTFVGGIQITF